jgi:diguanylate cyclase (GGDEF)-like protein
VAGTEHAFVCVADPASGLLVVRAGLGVFSSLVGAVWCEGAESSRGRRFPNQSAEVTGRTTLARRRPELFGLGVRSLLEAPLGSAGLGGVIGAGLLNAGARFGRRQVESFTLLGLIGALKLESGQLSEFAQRELRERQQTEEELRELIGWLQRSEDELRRSRAETIARLAHAAEFRSLETGVHLERMSRYCATLAARLGFSEERIEVLRAASTLHDIGKIAIPDEVLQKPGPLTETERSVMTRHAEIGSELLAGSGSASEVLEMAALVALTHHERFDGSGYPRGLAGEEIPIEGRIAAVADVFDALISDRVYRPAMPLSEALAIMREGRGSHFDPQILDLFLESIDELQSPPTSPTILKDPLDPDASTIGWGEHIASSTDLPVRNRAAARESARPGGPTAAQIDYRGVINPARLRDACNEAVSALEKTGDGKEAIDLAIAHIAHGWEGKLIASVYLVEHDRLWVISQRGYAEVVHDGFPLDQGVMARAVRSGETQFIADVTNDPDFVAATGGLVSEVAVPFPADVPVGVFNLETVDIKLPAEVASLFDPFVAALSARLETMRAGLRLDIASLARVCVHASSLRGSQAIAEFATRTFGRLLNLESAQLVLSNNNGSGQIASHWRRPDSQLAALSPTALELLIQTESHDATVTAYGVAPAATLGRDSDTDSRAPWVVWFPLRVGGHELGTLVGRAATRDIDRELTEAVSLIAQHTAALLDIAQRLRREERAATTDALTGLLNRRGFEERLAQELARAERHTETLSLLSIDCDGLKRINDLDGHSVGDQALQQMAATIRAHRRVSDPAARLGGDEFVIILAGTTATEATAIAERIRSDVTTEVLGNGHRLTASIGLATFPHDATTPDALVLAADSALYQAKRNGGDRLVSVT